MSRLKRKLVLKRVVGDGIFAIVKTVNTLEFGLPNDELDRKEVDSILRKAGQSPKGAELTVEFIN